LITADFCRTTALLTLSGAVFLFTFPQNCSRTTYFIKILTFLYGDFIGGEYSDEAGNRTLRLKRFHDTLLSVQLFINHCEQSGWHGFAPLGQLPIGRITDHNSLRAYVVYAK
jgi:hypothetical protein